MNYIEHHDTQVIPPRPAALKFASAWKIFENWGGLNPKKPEIRSLNLKAEDERDVVVTATYRVWSLGFRVQLGFSLKP